MPLIEPTKADSTPTNRREKIIVCGATGVGKTTAPLSVALWAHLSGDTTRRFWFLDFEDSAGDLLLDPKYDGMTNLEVIPVEPEWNSWRDAATKAIENAQRGDFIIGDMIDRGWKLVQDWEAQMVRKTTRADTILDAAKEGARGWETFKETNWIVVNSEWDQFIKPLLLRSPAHLIFTTEEVDLGTEAKRNEPADTTNARREFGRFKPAGQKSMPYQARSIVRIARTNRGRLISTIKDRAREELSNEDMKPDFFCRYMRDVGGWSVA